MSRQYQSVPPNQSFGQVKPAFEPESTTNSVFGRRPHPGQSSGPPPSFKTDVNRTKTKRWVEAKSYSYDGDDWGEADEYDEYGNYDDEPQHMLQEPDRPTGLRQQGQSTATSAPGYPNHGRNNSFDEGAERRQFSTGAPPLQQQQANSRPSSRPGQQPSPASFAPNFATTDGRFPPAQTYPEHAIANHQPPYGPPPTHSHGHPSFDGPSGPSMNQQSRPSLDGPSGPSSGPPLYAQGRPSIDSQRGPGYPPLGNYRGVPYSDSRSQSMTSNTSSLDFQGRRDFSPTAMPPPLSTRGSPAPPNMSHPPRKSSLSQVNSPPDFNPSPQDFQSSAQPGDMPQTRSDRADSNASTKPLPFVRPADIYRRMQEEREKERQSQDSSRPSMDVVLGDQPLLPEKQAPASTQTSDGVPTPEARENSVSQTGSEAGARRNLPVLDSITERSPRGSPLLPEVSRMSGFGESFLGSTSLDNTPPDLPIELQETSSKTSPPEATATDLQHQNSLGFRSVVHQAFDRPEDLNPVSPMSASSSNIVRTNSESTNAVSPIISRASSNAHTEAKARDEAHREASVPSIMEEPAESLLRSSLNDTPSTPKGGRERSETQIYAPLSRETPPPAFKPGHRRDMSTPSPDNSPARTPVLETNHQTAEPQDVEVATTTPVESQNRRKLSNFGITHDQRGPPRLLETSSAQADSPSKGKVRDIVGKLESPTKERRGVDGTDEMSHVRPANNRLESFRPQLPGGWDSYSIAPPSQPQRTLHTSNRAPTDIRDPFVEDPSGQTSLQMPQIYPRASQADAQSKTAESKNHPQLSDPFSSVTAAGSALANAFVAAVGMKEPAGSDSESESEPRTAVASRSRANTELHPNAARPLPPNPDYSPVSSVAPTPLAKDTPMETPRTGHPDYFPPVVPLKQKPRGSVSPEFDTPDRIHSNILPSLSIENSPQDYESDRLRKELVRELSPSSGHFDRSGGSPPPVESRPDSTQIASHARGHDSMGLPQEYDSYWNDSNSIGPSSRPASHGHPLIREPMSVDGPGDRQISSMKAPESNDSIQQSSNRLQVQQPELTHRFSWEELPEEISTSREASAEPSLPPRVDSDMKDLPSTPRPESLESSVRPTSFGSDLAAAQLATTSDNASPPSERFNHSHANTNANLDPPPAMDSNQSSQLLQRDSTEHEFSNEPDRMMASRLPPPKNDPGKIAAFREIMAMKSSAERVQSFNETRQQFASMNTGLSSWIAATLNDLPEHSNLLDNGGRFTVEGHKPSPSRGKLAGLRLSNTQSQQPYYQQYLDASGLSPTSTSTPTPSKQGQNSSPIYTPASSGPKLTTRQMQAKGKDLLHGAGVFGGKANVVAKGLFSKGKSKLRGSDKALPPTPRVEPRSPRFSFGMPRRSSQPQPMPPTPISFDDNSAEVPKTTASPIRPESSEIVPPAEPLQSSSRLSQDVFALPPSNLLDMPAPATPPQETVDFDGRENDGSLLSPASVSSSNKTPTQGSFRKNSWAHDQLPLTPLQKFRNMSYSQGDAKALPVPPNELEESILAVAPPDLSHVETPPAVPVHTVPRSPRNGESMQGEGESSQKPSNDAHNSKPREMRTAVAHAPPVSRATESQASPRRSEDSEGTFRTAESGNPHGHGSEDVPTPLAQDSTRPSIDDSVVSDLSNPVENGATQAQQPNEISTRQTPSPNRTPRPFSFIKFDEPPRPSEGLSYGTRLEDEILPKQRHALPPLPMSPISPRQAQAQETIQSHDGAESLQSADHPNPRVSEEIPMSDQVAPVHHDTTHDFGPHDQSFTKKPRPRSFSRPFQDQSSRLRRDNHADGEAEKRLSAEMASPFYTMQSPTNSNQTPKQQDLQVQPKAQRPSVTNVDPTQKRSRTSGIFKNFSISPKELPEADNPSAPEKIVDQSAAAPPGVEKKSRRGKLLRTLTGRSNSDSNNSRDEVPALPKSRTDLGQDGFSSHPGSQHGGPLVSQENGPVSNHGNKFQRASTSGIAGENGGKKRRFSGFGSLFNQSRQRQTSVPAAAQPAAPWASQQQQDTQPTAPLRPLLHSRQNSSAYQETRQPQAAPLTSTNHPPPQRNDTSHQQEYYQPPTETMYDRPPLEGYYSPDRRSGNFSPAFISGQRSPRLGPQQFPPPSHDARQHEPSPADVRRQNRMSWQEGLPPASMNSPMYNSASPAAPLGQSHGQQTAQRTNSFNNAADPHPSWTRTPGQNDVPPLPPLSPPHRGAALDSTKQTTTQPRSSSMNYSLYPSPSVDPTSKRNTSNAARGLHEIDSPSQPPPQTDEVNDSAPPLPPKDSNGPIGKPRTSADFHPRHPAYQAYTQPNPAPNSVAQASPQATSPLPATNRHQNHPLPTLQTTFPNQIPEIGDKTSPSKQLTPEEVRRARQAEIEKGSSSSPRHGGTGIRSPEQDESSQADDVLGSRGSQGNAMWRSTGAEDRLFAMQGSSYPGQEWTPGYGSWDGN